MCVDMVLKSRSSLGDEVWAMLEQDIVSSLDLHDIKRAEKSCNEIRNRFGPDGNRVRILEGMICETKGKFAEAEAIYKDIKSKDETLQAPRKRIVACNRSRGKLGAAMEELVSYLDVWMTDHEAWLELADMYIMSEQHHFAAHCLEECILLQPYHYAHHCKYAEIMYTLGGRDDIETARKHFQQSLELKEDNVRAVYGLCQSAAALARMKTVGGRADKEEAKAKQAKLIAYGRSKLDAAYLKSFDKGECMSKSMNTLCDSLDA
jgi:tetratricopeptide (TPR) repeat protein